MTPSQHRLLDEFVEVMARVAARDGELTDEDILNVDACIAMYLNEQAYTIGEMDAELEETGLLNCEEKTRAQVLDFRQAQLKRAMRKGGDNDKG